MKRLLLLLAIILSLLAACTPQQTHFPTIEDEYTVYSAVLEHGYFWGDPLLLVNEKLFVPKEKYLNDIFATLSLIVPGFDQTGWKDYLELDGFYFENNLNQSKHEIIFIDFEETYSLGELSDKFPNSLGYITFSKVAFHPYREEAIVLASQGIPKGQRFYVYLLEKLNGKWVVVGGGTYGIS